MLILKKEDITNEKIEAIIGKIDWKTSGAVFAKVETLEKKSILVRVINPDGHKCQKIYGEDIISLEEISEISFFVSHEDHTWLINELNGMMLDLNWRIRNFSFREFSSTGIF